jgi:hypothetical protein
MCWLRPLPTFRHSPACSDARTHPCPWPPPPQVLVVAATNRATSLDDALLRPGRFDRTVYMGRPSPSNRLKILQAGTASRPAHLAPCEPTKAGSKASLGWEPCLPAWQGRRAGGHPWLASPSSLCHLCCPPAHPFRCAGACPQQAA